MNLIKKIRNKFKLCLAAFVAQFLFISNAFAQFTPPPATDMSRQFINQIFGGLLDGGQDAFGDAIATFNGAVLIVGGILVTYTIFAGTLGTAHDGEMLGKKFSSVWIPIRTALGTSLVLPVMTGGYCVMQVIVMWLIMQGCALGNMVWESYMSKPPILTMTLGTQSKKEITKFVEDVYLANLCVASLNQGSADIDKFVPIISVKTNYGYALHDGVYYFGDQQNLKNQALCGTVTLPSKPKVVNGNVTTSLSSINSSASIFKAPDLTGIYDAHITQIENVLSKTQDIAVAAIADGSKTNYSELQKLIDEYVAKINEAGDNAIKATNASKLTAQQGWFLAGTWATQIINQQNKINNAGQSLGVVTFNSIRPTFLNKETVYKYAERGYSILQDKRPELQPNYDAEKKSSDKSNEEASPSSLSIGGKFMRAITSSILDIDITTVKTSTKHPLILLTDLGNQILNAIMAGVLAAVAIAVVLGVKVAGFGVEMAAPAIAIFGALAGPMLAFQGIGGMLAYILPNTPFFIWIGIIVGWTLMVVEAILAAPLWAVMHLHPSGDDMTGRGGNGYMLVLGLMLRPALIIFGLIAAIVMSDIFGKLLNLIFFDLFLSNTPDGTLGFFGMLFGTGLYCGMMWLVIKNTFAMMHNIPDQMLRWIGGGQEQLGQYANQMNEGTMQKAAAAGGAAAGLLTDKALGGFSQSLSGVRQANDNRKNKDEKEAALIKNEQKDLHNQQKEAQTKEGEVDKKLGSNGAAITGSTASDIMSGNFDSYSSMQKQSQVDTANQVLGGKDSAAATEFRENMAADIQNGMPFEQAFSKNMESSLDKTYGSGAGKLASQATDNTFGGSRMLQMANKMKEVQSLYRGTPNQLSSQSSAFQAANKLLQKGKASTPTDAIDQSINHILANSRKANKGGSGTNNKGV